MWTIILGLFLAAHGLIHLAYIAPAPPDPKYPFRLSDSWLISSAGLDAGAVHLLGVALSALTALGFVLTGLAAAGVIVPQAWWQPLTIVSAVTSLLLFAVFWNSWMIVGVAIDVVLLIAVLGLHWQPFAA